MKGKAYRAGLLLASELDAGSAASAAKPLRRDEANWDAGAMDLLVISAVARKPLRHTTSISPPVSQHFARAAMATVISHAC